MSNIGVEPHWLVHCLVGGIGKKTWLQIENIEIP